MRNRLTRENTRLAKAPIESAKEANRLRGQVAELESALVVARSALLPFAQRETFYCGDQTVGEQVVHASEQDITIARIALERCEKARGK